MAKQREENVKVVLKSWERRGWSLEADAAKCFKITNYSFGAITIQSSQPGEPEGSGSRESNPVSPVRPVQLFIKV